MADYLKMPHAQRAAVDMTPSQRNDTDELPVSTRHPGPGEPLAEREKEEQTRQELDEWYQRGVVAERARIVVALRSYAGDANRETASELADELETGRL